MKFNWYKWLWTKIGGRPWTYIIRDSYHNMPIVWLIVLLAIGAWLGDQFSLVPVLKVSVILLIGVLLGHLFWGTKWIPNQPGVLDTKGGIRIEKFQ